MLSNDKAAEARRKQLETQGRPMMRLNCLELLCLCKETEFNRFETLAAHFLHARAMRFSQKRNGAAREICGSKILLTVVLNGVLSFENDYKQSHKPSKTEK